MRKKRFTKFGCKNDTTEESFYFKNIVKTAQTVFNFFLQFN